jgi:hypothetical protein
LKSQEETVNTLTNKFNRGPGIPWLSISAGANKFRIFPAHEGTKGNLFIFPKAVSWLPQEVKVIDKDDKDKKERIEIKNRPIFNSKVHGGTAMDLVEEYVKFATKHFTEEIADKKDLEKKLEPILNWKTGIKPKTSWVCYANEMKIDGTKEFGKLEFPNSVREQLNTLSATEDADQSITVDPFTHPDNGKAILIKYDPNNTDAKKKYATSLLWQNNWALTDEELEEFDKVEKLENLFKNCFKRSDFEKQMKGLEIFDAKNKFNIFSFDAFLDIVEKIDAYFPVEETKEGEAEGLGMTNGEKSEVKAETKAEVKAELSAEQFKKDLLDEMGTDELKQFIAFEKLDVSPRATHTAERIRIDIREALLEKNANVEVSHVVSMFLNSLTKTEEAPKVETPDDMPFKVEEKKVESAEVKTGMSKLDELKNKYKTQAQA